jgi:hypothetical protein
LGATGSVPATGGWCATARSHILTDFLDTRAQGMPGACCTRGLVCNKCTKNAHEHTGTAGAARHSLRSGLTAYTALSPETNSSCLRRRRIEGLPKPGRVDFSSAGLTPATGARTIRLCRTQPRQSSARCVRSRAKARPANSTTRPTLPRPPQPAPTFVTMANAPLPGRDGGSCRGDLGLARSGIFLRARLDGANHVEVVSENQSFKKIDFRARQLFSNKHKRVARPIALLHQ